MYKRKRSSRYGGGSMSKKRKYSYRRKSRTMSRRSRAGHLIMKRKVAGTIAVGNADQANNFNFQINNVNTGSELSAMFDMYKISRVKVTFEPLVTAVQSSFGNSTTAFCFPTMPRCYGAIDYNDDDIPGSSSVLRELSNCRVWDYSKGQTFYFKPMLNVAVERSTNTSTPGYNTDPKWLKFDNNGSTIRHRGLKTYFEAYPPPGSGATWQAGYSPLLNYTITYYIKLKNVK